MDGVCGKRSNPAAVHVARRVGCDALQVTLEPLDGGEKLKLADPGLQARFREEARHHRAELVSTYLSTTALRWTRSPVHWRIWRPRRGAQA